MLLVVLDSLPIPCAEAASLSCFLTDYLGYPPSTRLWDILAMLGCIATRNLHNISKVLATVTSQGALIVGKNTQLEGTRVDFFCSVEPEKKFRMSLCQYGIPLIVCNVNVLRKGKIYNIFFLLDLGKQTSWESLFTKSGHFLMERVNFVIKITFSSFWNLAKLYIYGVFSLCFFKKPIS